MKLEQMKFSNNAIKYIFSLSISFQERDKKNIFCDSSQNTQNNKMYLFCWAQKRKQTSQAQAIELTRLAVSSD